MGGAKGRLEGNADPSTPLSGFSEAAMQQASQEGTRREARARARGVDDRRERRMMTMGKPRALYT